VRRRYANPGSWVPPQRFPADAGELELFHGLAKLEDSSVLYSKARRIGGRGGGGGGGGEGGRRREAGREETVKGIDSGTVRVGRAMVDKGLYSEGPGRAGRRMNRPSSEAW
jgi:hypothetical protein